MQKSHNFKGKILFSPEEHSEKKTLMSYYNESMDAGFENTIMSSFDFLNFSAEEKKQLSTRHRKMLNNYRSINPFALNLDAKELVEQIEKCKASTLIIEANDYGAYICLAALYSGKLPSNKKIEFHFEGAPLALFPKAFLKSQPKNSQHKIIFRVRENCWLSPFRSLYSNNLIKCMYNTSAPKNSKAI
ncbi:MAG: hypothetical protein K2Q18_00510 [Bdellovibrionales bacterium]|nr:hypothetical protein [Bdellovibrionales bacterium]